MWFNLFLAAHVAAGSLGLLCGPLALVVNKGGVTHKRIGLVFYYAMLGVAATSLVLAVLHHQQFLFAVGIFSGYMAFTGRAVLVRKQQGRTHQLGWPELVVSGLVVLVNLYFLGVGTIELLHHSWFGLVFLSFVLSTGRMLRQDYQLLRGREVAANFWLIVHITRMIGATIAAYTAFFVVNAHSRYSLLAWLAPGVVGALLLAYWKRRVQTAPRRVAQPVAVAVAA